jgi:nickel-dependent lactate racemase
MNVELVFGDDWINVTMPETTQIVKPGFSIPIEPVTDLEKAVGEALRNPLDAKPLSDLVKPDWKITIAFDDPTVPCYAPVWETAISKILRELKKVGVSESQITLLCANALHRKFRLPELETILGAPIVQAFKDRIFCHDAEDPDGIVHLGETSSGYDVEINRRVVESNLTVYVNAVSTGFNGGWKSICVGLSTWRSIRWHHTPEIMTMSLVKNPMHDILNEMGEIVKSIIGQEKIFKVETLLANPFEVARVWAGSVDATRREALDLLKAHTPPRRQLLQEKADIVCYGIPYWSPYAAFATMTPILTLISTGLGYLGGMIEAAGKPGCSVIIATPCPNQWDDIHHPTHREIWEHILAETLDPNEIMRRYADKFAKRADYIAKYRFEHAFHPVHGILALHPLKRLRNVNQVFIAGAQDPKLIQRLGFTPTKTVEEAVNKAQAIHGKDAVVACVQYPMMVNRQ